MSKLKSKQDVIEWYWPDFLSFCIRTMEMDRKYPSTAANITPTVDNFWSWYIQDGPMGVKHRNLYYTKEDVQYV